MKPQMFPGLLPEDNHKVVNVASVPQRSPFRYPGGKTWLIPRVRAWLSGPETKPAVFVEPFAGGASVGLTVAAEDLAGHVVLVELDEDVAAVWQTILRDDGGADWLAGRIAAFDPTPDSLSGLFAQPPAGLRERAFQTLVKNRVQRGGILAPGAGLIRHGEDGKGLRSRWYPRTLATRIRAIAAIRPRITFIEGDGLQVLREYGQRRDVVFFIDPPYTAAGKRAGSRLYRHAGLDHPRLFELVGQVAGDFLMTYDNAEEVRSLAQTQRFDTCAVAMKNTHHATMTELLIGRNLDWARVAGPR